MPLQWTYEKLSKLDTKSVRTVLENATRKNDDLVSRLCISILEDREVALKISRSTGGIDHQGKYVAGYHFICKSDTGVEDLGNGQFWTRTWAVARDLALKSVEYGAYVALHENKSSPSYRQGKLIRIEVGSRGQSAKIEEGVDFLVESAEGPKLWVGNATGERGYLWEPLRRIGSEI